MTRTPVTRKSLGLMAGGMLLVVLGSMLGFCGYSYFAMAIDLHQQPGQMQLPPVLEANVAATNTFDINLDGNIKVDVPIDQPLDIPLTGTYKTRITMDTPIPVQFKVRYRGIIPIKTTAQIESTTALVLPKLPALPLTFQLPLEFNLPVDLEIPVNTQLRFAYHGPILLGIDQITQTRLTTRLHTRVPVQQRMRVPLLTSFNVQVYPEQKPLGMLLDAQLQQPLNQIEVNKRPHP